jgi:hypothetical protein
MTRCRHRHEHNRDTNFAFRLSLRYSGPAHTVAQPLALRDSTRMSAQASEHGTVAADGEIGIKRQPCPRRGLCLVQAAELCQGASE